MDVKKFIMGQPVDAKDALQCVVRGVEPVTSFNIFFDQKGEESARHEWMPYAVAYDVVQKLRKRFKGQRWRFSVLTVDTSGSEKRMVQLESRAKGLIKEGVDPKTFIMQQPELPSRWYFDVTSENYGTETYGPYDYEQEAREGLHRVLAKAVELNDGVEREINGPYEMGEPDDSTGDEALGEGVNVRKFIMGQTGLPHKWSDLKPGDVVYDYDNGSIYLITRQRPRGTHSAGYADEDKTLYDEYGPAYAYTDNNGPFIQHLSTAADDDLTGCAYLGRAEELGDLWNLMRKFYLKRWAGHYPAYWPRVQEAINAKRFILRQPDWSFKVEYNDKRGFDRYETKIFFHGEQVAMFWTFKRPRTDRWKRGLAKLHEQSPFEETTDCAFNDWLLKNGKHLTWDGLVTMAQLSEAEVNVRNFINKFGNTWSFTEVPYEGPGLYAHTVKVYCNGVFVGGFDYRPKPHGSQRPDFSHMRRALEAGDQTHLFVPGTDHLYSWAQDVGVRLMPEDWGPAQYWVFSEKEVETESEIPSPKDFIMDRLPSVEDVCNKFALGKTADEYKEGQPIWPGSAASGHITRFQSWKGNLPLRNEVTDDWNLPLKHLEVVVVYSEEAYPSNTLYNARIDVGVGGRSKKLYSNDDEFKLASWVERYLNRLYAFLAGLRTVKRKQLERGLASLGFKVHEANEDAVPAALLEAIEPRNFIMDVPTVASVCAKWGFKEVGHFESNRPLEETWHFAGLFQLPRSFSMGEKQPDPDYGRTDIKLTVWHTIDSMDFMEKPDMHRIKLATDLSWKEISTLGYNEGEIAEELNDALTRLRQLLARVKGTTNEQLQKSVHRWLTRGWPRRFGS